MWTDFEPIFILDSLDTNMWNKSLPLPRYPDSVEKVTYQGLVITFCFKFGAPIVPIVHNRLSLLLRFNIEEKVKIYG